MKHYSTTLLSLSLLTALQLSGAPSSPKLLKLICPNNKTEIVRNSGQTKEFANAASPIWKAGKSDTFHYDNATAWEKDYTTTYSYRTDGLLKKELQESPEQKTRTVYEYDAENRISSITEQQYDGTAFVNQRKTEYAYDDILKDATISEINYLWDESGNTWQTSYPSSRIEIERNSDGNVTSVKSYASFLDSELYLFYTMNISYNDNGVADKIEIIDLDGMNITLSDIIWIETDGQLIMGDSIIFLGNNKLSSCTMTFEEEGIAMDGQMRFNYTNETDFTYEASIGGINAFLTHEEPDSNGSYKETLYNYIDMNSNGEMEDDEITLTEITEITYNDDKLPVLEYYYEKDNIDEPEFSYADGTKYDYTYNETYGIPSEVIISTTNRPDTEYQPKEKIAYYDFINAANPGGISSLSDSGFSLTVSGNRLDCELTGLSQCGIYDLNGRLVIRENSIDKSHASVDISGLQPGIYVVQAKSAGDIKTRKFIKR